MAAEESDALNILGEGAERVRAALEGNPELAQHLLSAQGRYRHRRHPDFFERTFAPSATHDGLTVFADSLSGALGLFGIERPFRIARSAQDPSVAREKLLRFIGNEVDSRLRNSLHNWVKLDLYMEDQQHRVGRADRKYELVPEDPLPVNRVLYSTDLARQPLVLKLTQKIDEVFNRPDIQQKLLILGEPGAGKTTELLTLAKALIAQAKADLDRPIPIILELSTWKGESIEFWITVQLKKRFNLETTIVQQWLERARRVRRTGEG